MENKRAKLDQSVGAEPLGTQAGSSKPTNDEDKSDERNPMLMEDILDIVFKFVNATQDIMNARLVCKAWWQNASNAKKLLKVPLAFPVDRFSKPKIADVARFRRFLDTMDNSELLPFKNYTISSKVLITTEEEDKGDVLDDFFRICGPDVVSLKLDLESKVGRKLEIPKEVNVGKLKNLSLSIQRNEDAPIHEFNLLAGLILDSASSLQKFEYLFDDMLFKSLTDKGLQLKELILHDNVKPKSMEESKTIQKFLQTQTATLLRLEIWNPSVNNRICCSLSLPMLEKLVHLKLRYVKIAPFVVGEIFPKLRCLDVRNWESKSVPDIIIAQKKKKKYSATLKELWLPCSFPSKLIRNLSLNFPLITKLHIGGESIAHVLEQVFIHFPLLNHLGLDSQTGKGSFCIDSVLCGIPRDVCRRISRLPLTRFRNLNLSELQRKPSLVNLTLLQTLEIENYCGDGPSDISAQFVFFRMPNLKALKGYGCLFSTAYIEALQERIPKFKFLEMDYPPYRDLEEEEEDSYEEEQDTEDGETDMEDN